jgi:basic membrane lipoprotein Med (substrate-binding protein (PBP1-ABC) superfamily)
MEDGTRLGRRSGTAIAALLFLALPLACGEPPSEGPAAFRVALLTPGSVRDAGWNQSAWEGLVAIRDELGAETAHQETRTPQEFEAGFRDFAARGFDLVFGHGFEFQDAAARVGTEFPETVFITTSGSTIRSNVSPVVFELEQATYVLGFVGARLSRTGRLGAVGGIEIPSVASTFLAFEAGAREGLPSAELATTYIGGWEDVGAAREATLAQIAAGSDVLIHNADAAARGFLPAAAESEGILAFGTNRDQNALAPGAVLASAVLDIPRALLLVAREVREGRFEPRSIRFGLADGVVAIAWNEALASRMPDDLRRDAEALVARIESGELRVPRAGF